MHRFGNPGALLYFMIRMAKILVSIIALIVIHLQLFIIHRARNVTSAIQVATLIHFAIDSTIIEVVSFGMMKAHIVHQVSICMLTSLELTKRVFRIYHSILLIKQILINPLNVKCFGLTNLTLVVQRWGVRAHLSIRCTFLATQWKYAFSMNGPRMTFHEICFFKIAKIIHLME